MDDKEQLWIGWKDISLENDLIGETVSKGKDIWKKDYTYIKTPKGYGYDNYCFLLSSNCVHSSYFSICDDMNIELVYDPDLREEGKKYKRYKLKGYELFELVFKDYEINFFKESEDRNRMEREERERKDRKKIGRCVCGIYKGNNSIYDTDLKYKSDFDFKAYFQLENGSRYANKRFDKVENVRVIYEICSGISKYEFNKWEDIINAYLGEFQQYYVTSETLKKKLECNRNYSKVERWLYPELMVETKLEDITESVLKANEKAWKEVQERLQKRIEKLQSNERNQNYETV